MPAVSKHRRFRDDDDDVWQAAQEKAKSEGTTISAKIRWWLREYVAGRLK